MESWYPFVIGTVIFFYIHSFNRIARIHLENERTLSWSDFFTKVIPIQRPEQPMWESNPRPTA